MGLSLENGEYNVIPELVIPFLCDPDDRAAVSLVCTRWYQIDRLTRKHVKIGNCYATTPGQLSRRFPQLESLKLKGKPRVASFSFIPKNWGGFATSWVEELARAFPRLKSVSFRRMIVKDSDLELLATAKGGILEVLKLDNCYGFSTDGLLHITRSCKNLRTLFLEVSRIIENDGKWLHELALNNMVLENLNFYWAQLSEVNQEDLKLMAENCRSLVSLKINYCDELDLLGLFQRATALEEFFCSPFLMDLDDDVYNNPQGGSYAVAFPHRLWEFGLAYLGRLGVDFIFPIAAKLRKLDILDKNIDIEGHCRLLQECPNLEVLQTSNAIGNRGLEILALFCKRLRRLTVERGFVEEVVVSQGGLIAVAQGCLQLEYLVVHVAHITNEVLQYLGKYSKNLCHLRLILFYGHRKTTDVPLDDGVRSLLIGCSNLRRLCLDLRPGVLTDVGLLYIAKYGSKISWMHLGNAGESDVGLIALSWGCTSLRKLEMRACPFSCRAVANAVLNLTSLRFISVQGRMVSGDGGDLLEMVRPYWNIELMPAGRVVTHKQPLHMIAYYSLAGQRTDFPDTVVPLDQSTFL